MAVDIGGVRRDFVSRLFEGVFLQQEEGFLPCDPREEGKWPLDDGKEETKLALRTVGALFALCYAGTSNFKTGKLFPEVLFPLLKNSGLLPNDPLITEKQIKNFLLISGISEGISENILHLTKHQLSKEEIEKIPEKRTPSSS